MNRSGARSSALGVLPAQQGLDADHAARADVELRLIVDLELPALQGANEIALERLAFAQLGVHPFLEEAIGARLLGLGPAERQAGVLKQVLRLVAITGEHRDADPGAHTGQMTTEIERLGQDREEALAKGRGGPRRLDLALDDRELVGTHPGQHVGFTQDPEQPRAGVAQQHVACGTA